MSELLARSLLAGVGLNHGIDNPKLIETHISWLILVGDVAYKLKKNVSLGFLDFSTLERRKHFCEEEVRINRRTAPDIYLDVLPISGSEAAPRVGDDSKPFEYLVRMKRFSEASILENLSNEGELEAGIISSLACDIAAFHQAVPVDKADGSRGSVKRIREPVAENFRQIEPIAVSKEEQKMLRKLGEWVAFSEQSLAETFRKRHADGFVRECHGDMHLANLFYHDGHCIPFDGIEFDPDLRWIDTASDLAFTVMDLDTHKKHDLSQQLLNEYLEHTGDYGLLSVLPYYLVYRAMVRAKVTGIRSAQDMNQSNKQRRQCDDYLSMAIQYTRAKPVCLILMSGFSGSGKTTVAKQLSVETSAICIRSDVERKRLFGLASLASSRDMGLDIYTEEANQNTVQRLIELTSMIFDAGCGVVVDATLITAGARRAFESLAMSRNIPWCLVHCEASPETIRTRLELRDQDASEAGYVQYQAQQALFEEFDVEEQASLVRVDTESTSWVESCKSEVSQFFAKNSTMVP